MELLAHLIHLIAAIWRGDSQLREHSLVGESGLDRSSRRFVAWFCGGLILILVVAAIGWGLLAPP
ncbi:MAG: hypothetical protein V4584_16960 [Verrucomicrobiota bacterium]